MAHNFFEFMNEPKEEKSDFSTVAGLLHTAYTEFVNAGFTDEQAMLMICESLKAAIIIACNKSNDKNNQEVEV